MDGKNYTVPVSGKTLDALMENLIMENQRLREENSRLTGAAEGKKSDEEQKKQREQLINSMKEQMDKYM